MSGGCTSVLGTQAVRGNVSDHDDTDGYSQPPVYSRYGSDAERHECHKTPVDIYFTAIGRQDSITESDRMFTPVCLERRVWPLVLRMLRSLREE